ncbi:DUF2326 domain-containing protein [Draconibacterium sp. IB214405]|uniref:DUF2326 domain-containing protein n=1 Tax=Draconibacterium sp. IB214405 TaxID=3097352 RepID=UPI002A0CBB9E|nr:DUF2326 domain-containing protein [Draconibacterium sp. IB214405]MDX8341661.1 DUF2326 domain-containing protein [Draconibacterium sp. IB214405]
MQLSKLYCNKANFKNIKFNLNGLNVIYAEVKSSADEKNNSHDLGKTKFAEMIDFMLLKQIDKNHFLLKIKKDDYSIFHEYVFYLELYLNSGEYLTIRRNIEANTKISFAINSQTSDEFTPPKNWDVENYALKKARSVLSEYLAMDFFQNKIYDYRKSISYSLRKQDDFKDVYKLNKFAAGKDIDWKPFMFDLLGFNGELLTLKYANDTKIENINSVIDSWKRDFSVRVEDRDEIVAEKSIVETEFKEIEDQIDRFNFYQQDKTLIEKGINDIENKIGLLNSKSYRLNYEIDKLKTSIRNNFSFDIEKVKKIFEETAIYFPEHLESDYKGLISFNKKLTLERNKLLKETLKNKDKQLKETNEQLILSNQEREKLMQHLVDSDTFSKFKRCQKELVKVEGNLLKFEEKLKIIDKIFDKEKDIEVLRKEIKSTIEELKRINQTTDKNEKYNSIRSSFTKYYKAIMDENAVLSWKINTNDNVEFLSPKVKSKINDKLDTAKDEGNTYMKLLCVAFDLSILSTYNPESYYRFVYHDDVLSQQDNGIKTRLLLLVDELTKQLNLQYILSAIKSDLPVGNNDMPIKFAEEDIVLKLHDKDSTGTLFGFEF